MRRVSNSCVNGFANIAFNDESVVSLATFKSKEKKNSLISAIVDHKWKSFTNGVINNGYELWSKVGPNSTHTKTKIKGRVDYILDLIIISKLVVRPSIQIRGQNFEEVINFVEKPTVYYNAVIEVPIRRHICYTKVEVLLRYYGIGVRKYGPVLGDDIKEMDAIRFDYFRYAN